MKYLEVEIEGDSAVIVPIADIHVGDEAFKLLGQKKLNENIAWVLAHPNSRIFLNGDIYNVAGRNTKTSPFGSDKNEYLRAAEYFRPVAKQIIGATDGNHETRMMDMFGVSPMQWFCETLDIPYCQWSSAVRLRVGKRTRVESKGGMYHQTYNLYFHHTTGGGGSLGNKLNRVVKLGDIIEGIDVYCGSHNHQLAVAPQDVFYISREGELKQRRKWYVDCGSYLSWDDSYAEKGMMAPTKLGSPKIWFDGKTEESHHDIRVEI